MEIESNVLVQLIYLGETIEPTSYLLLMECGRLFLTNINTTKTVKTDVTTGMIMLPLNIWPKSTILGQKSADKWRHLVNIAEKGRRRALHWLFYHSAVQLALASGRCLSSHCSSSAKRRTAPLTL